MESFVASGRILDLVIAVMLAEVLVVRGLLRRPSALPLATVGAGLGLLLAWRCALAGWSWPWVAAALSAAGALHATDLWQRWRA